MKIEVVVQVLVDDTEFLLSSKDGNLTIAEAIMGEPLVIYKMASDPLDWVAKDLPGRIIQHIAKPHLIFESDTELLKFYLLLMNVINMFYIHEFTAQQGQESRSKP